MSTGVQRVYLIMMLHFNSIVEQPFYSFIGCSRGLPLSTAEFKDGYDRCGQLFSLSVSFLGNMRRFDQIQFLLFLIYNFVAGTIGDQDLGTGTFFKSPVPWGWLFK